MKKVISILVFGILLASIGVESCSKEKQDQIAYSIASSYINQGKWKVSLFQQGETNGTDQFAGYVFQFNTDGTVTAVKNDITVRGTWTTINEGSKTKMRLNFTPRPLEELNEDWVIKSGNASAIQLEHVREGNEGTDYLNFQKI